MSRIAQLTAIGVVVCTMGIGAATASANPGAPTAEVPTAAQTADLTAAQVALLSSGAPIDVTMDPISGDILSVTPASAAPAPEISNRQVCDTGDGCYTTNRDPYADEGFYGSAGTFYGTWLYRSGYSSGTHTVSACWSGGCGLEIPPGSRVSLTSDVTGTSFSIA